MPSRNIIKTMAADSYYHVYNRGVNKNKIFYDEQDYAVFLNLLKRYLDKRIAKDQYQRLYKNLREEVSLLTYCLMPNHYHLLILNKSDNGLEQLMRSVAISYAGYFNKKYHHIGPLFQGRYKASMITHDSYLQHISRYIHLNPKDYENYDYSSYKSFINNYDQPWLDKDALMTTFDGDVGDYKKFVADFNDYKKTLELIKNEIVSA